MKNSTVVILISITLALGIAFLWWSFSIPLTDYSKLAADTEHYWTAPDIMRLPDNDSGKLIKYGRELIVNTAKYYGPKGSIIANHTNGMNCQNCHLEAGTKIWGNNYSGVFATYPKYRARSGTVENIYKRVNDCFERSLNGKALDTGCKEMQAIKLYIEWLGKDVPKGTKPKGSGIYDLAFMESAADTSKGRIVFIQKCQSCHQLNGAGVLNETGTAYIYPPLWGEHSYNIGAGLYRLSRFAGYIKYNMPQGASFVNPQLTDEEAWNVAAFVNSQSRPNKNTSRDWPKIKEKPVDYPFGPFTDNFGEQQHKYGPFKSIAEEKERIKNNKPIM